MLRPWAALLAFGALEACSLSPFVCADDSGCSQRGQGRCEANGACSYPDTDCESGRRFSEYGPVDEGQCVPALDGGSTTASGGPATTPSGPEASGSVSGSATAPTLGDSTVTGDDVSSTGDAPDACGGCTGRGRCVLVDEAPTCACDPGWTMVGLECLEDPCATQNCYFVDSVEGDDDGPGSRDDPWQTRDRAWAYLAEASPGDHVLFRRGRTFAGTLYPRLSAQGSATAPIVVGAYGSPTEAAAPLFTEIELKLDGAQHVVVRDLALRGSGAGPCLFVEDSGHFTVHDLEVFSCGVRGMRVSGGSHHGVLFRNDVHDVGSRTAIFVADTTWTTPDPTVLGEHHWVAANIVRNSGELGIDAAFRPENHAPSEYGDIKLVHNEVSGTQTGGISVVSPAGWLVNNVVLGAVDPDIEYSGALVAQNSASWTHIRGNIAAGSNSALNIHGDGLVELNSVFQAGGNYSALRLASGISGASVVDNLVFADNTDHAQGVAAAFAELGELDRNIYAAVADGTCSFRVDNASTDLAGWQAASGGDVSARCEVVPGVRAPATSSVPVDGEFFVDVAPEPGWPGCDTSGAVACDGERRAFALRPSDDLVENAGRGWEGPLIIQQHYPLAR